VGSFKTAGLYPLDYKNKGWNEAFAKFGPLNRLYKQVKQQGALSRSGRDQHQKRCAWIVRAKQIDNDQVVILTSEEADILNGYMKNKERFGNGCVPEFLQGIPPLLIATAIGDQMIDDYINDSSNNDFEKPPQPATTEEEVALKLIEFVLVSSNKCIDTECKLSDEAIARDKLRSKLHVLKLGMSLQLRRKQSPTMSKVSIQKISVNKYNMVDHVRREGENCEVLSTERVLLEFVDCGDNRVELKRADEKAKESRKARKERKKSIAVKQAEAEARAKEEITKRNARELLKIAPLQCWQPLLDHTGNDLNAMSQALEALFEEPFSWKHEDIDVTLVGPSQSAVKESAKAIIFELLSRKMDETHKNQKSKRQKGAVTMTKSGASGPSLGIRIARDSNIEKLARVETEKKKVSDDLAKLQKLLQDAEELKTKMPENFWKADKTTGDKRKVLAKLYGVYQAKLNANDMTAAINGQVPTKEKTLEKIHNLKATNIAALRPYCSSERNQDFLAEFPDGGAKEDEDTGSNTSYGGLLLESEDEQE
jgi:hypothetical protein